MALLELFNNLHKSDDISVRPNTYPLLCHLPTPLDLKEWKVSNELDMIIKIITQTFMVSDAKDRSL